MTRTVIRYPGRPPRFVGPFGDEQVAREWFAEHGDNSRVTFVPLDEPDPPPARLPFIPRRISLRGDDDPRFARVEEFRDGWDEWFILGTEHTVPLGRNVRIRRHQENDVVTVHIDHYVAERTVQRKATRDRPGGATRYVLAAFTNENCADERDSR